MAMISLRPKSTSPTDVLMYIGGYVAVLSLGLFAIFMFVPVACNVIGGFQLVIIGLLFVAGFLTFAISALTRLLKRT